METMVQQFDVSRFLLAEREQRWRRIRQFMEHDGLDVIVVLSSSGLVGHVRYLSCIGGNHAPVAVVYPRTGEVTVLTGPVPFRDYWLHFQDWVTDIRAHFFSEGEALVERLRELSLERGRIGLVGLADLPRLPEGVIPHGLYLKLCHAFPNAELINATFLLVETRGTTGIHTLVSKDEVDVGLTTPPPPRAGLQFEPMYTEAIVALVPEAYPFSTGEAIPPGELAKTRVILTNPTCAYREVIQPD